MPEVIFVIIGFLISGTSIFIIGFGGYKFDPTSNPYSNFLAVAINKITCFRRSLAIVALVGLAIAVLPLSLTFSTDATNASNRSQALDTSSVAMKNQDYAQLIAFAAQPNNRKNSMSPLPYQRKQVAGVDEMIDRLAARLAKSPNDAEGWRMLGWSYFHTKKYEKSKEAYARAINLNSNQRDWLSAYGESIVKASGNKVTPEARAIFEKVLESNAKDLRSRFYIGLTKQQDGHLNGALDLWTNLKEEVPRDHYLYQELGERTSLLAKELNVNSTQANPKNEKYSERPRKTPTSEDIRAAQSLSPEERQAMINSMVEGLENRLRESPRDTEGWIKLIRSRVVLNELDKARQALKTAIKSFENDKLNQTRIITAAKSLGIRAE